MAGPRAGRGLRLWRLDQNGFDNEYYAAAVRSMMVGWHAFFYNSFDPAGFVSVDKPPLALWIQVASVKLFGFRPLAVLLPQVLEGVAAVAVLSHLVRRHWGATAGRWPGSSWPSPRSRWRWTAPATPTPASCWWCCWQPGRCCWPPSAGTAASCCSRWP